MKTSFKSIIKASMLAAVMSLFFVACGDKEQEITPTPPGPTTVAVTGVSLSKTSLTLTEGGSETIAASVTPSNATNQAVSWSSSNTGVATVDGGKVTAVKAGSATITVTTSDGGKTAKCEVTVEAKVIPVSGITVDKETLSIVEGEDATLTATVAPEDASDKTFAWSTSDEKVATVDENGKVTAVAAGTATITATTTDGGKTAKCEVTVEAKVIPVEGVTVDKETLEMVEGDEATLAATVAPEEATDKTVAWSTSDEAVATVDAEGKVTAVAPGTATITVTTTDGEKTAKCEVTVSAKVIPVESVALDKETLEMVEGDEASIAATVTPEEATDKTVKWTSSDETVATVDAEGKVTAGKAGTATITAKSDDGGKTATCAVTVEAKVIPVEGVEFAEATISVIEGQAGKVSVVFKPETPTNTNVTFESADPAVATVDAEGNVTGVAPGATTITVTTEDGGMTATCDVTVEPKPIPVSKVEINRTAINLIVESSAILVATVSPEDATNKNVVWSSSDESIVKVDQKGEVTAVKVGKATVTVTTEDGGKTFDCEVTVSDKPIQVTGVSIYPSSRTINVGYSYQLTANITPADATNHEVKWTSSNTSIATVDETGKVTAIKPGTATITVKTANNGKTATCKITVPENITVKKGSTEITENYTLVVDLGESVQLMPFDKTKNTEIRTMLSPSSITTSNSSVAEVGLVYAGGAGGISAYNGWKITGKKSGTATVTMKYSNMTRRITVKVKEYTIYYNNKEVPSTLPILMNSVNENINFTLYNKTEGKAMPMVTSQQINDFQVTSSNDNVIKYAGTGPTYKICWAKGEGTAVMTFKYKDITIKTVTLKVIHKIEVRYGGSALGATSTYYWNGQSGHSNRSISFSYYDKVDGKLITLSSSNHSKFEIKSSSTSIISNNIAWDNTEKECYAYAYGTATLTFTYNDVEIATTKMTVKEPRFGIALKDLSNYALLVEESSATPYFFYVNKDGSERYFTIYDYDCAGSISNKLTYGPSFKWVSSTNSKFHFISYSNDSNNHARIAFSQEGAKEGESAIITFMVKRPNGTWHTVRLEVRNGI